MLINASCTLLILSLFPAWTGEKRLRNSLFSVLRYSKLLGNQIVNSWGRNLSFFCTPASMVLPFVKLICD